MIPNKPIILIDGSSYLYRAFHAMPSLTNSKGTPTGAIYGVVNMLRRLLLDYDPEYVAVVFDAKGKTFRDDLYDKYKANRQAMPDELSVQIETIHNVINALGLPLLMIEGVEADDVIGTLAKNAEKKGLSTVISTSDKDLAQLVGNHITLVNTMTASVLDTTSVKEKFGIPPELIIDYLALVGDSIDNIPGVPQVGPKTAVKWLIEYGSLDNIIANADKISGKVGENLRNSLSQLPLSKQLATIKLDVNLDIDLSALKRNQPNQEILIQLYKELEFKTWLNELLTTAPPEKNDKYKNCLIILNEKDLDNWISTLTQTHLFSFEIETNEANYMDAEIIGISFACGDDKTAYIPLAHASSQQLLPRELVINKLKSLFESLAYKKISYDIKHQTEILANYKIDLKGVAFDILLEAYVLDSTSSNHNLDTLALKYLGKRIMPYEEIAGKGAKQIPFKEVSIHQAARYSIEKADIMLQLQQQLVPLLSDSKGLKYIYESVELPLAPVLARIERNGVLIDANMLDQQNTELEKRLNELEIEAHQLAGEIFNLNSPKQLQEILFQKLKLPVLQKTPTGQPSTGESVLQELALEYPLPKLIIEHRGLCKLITTYTKKLPQQINLHTKRVHTSYHQTGAATGRLSSSDPNLQNIPVRTKEGRRIRQAFIPPKGYKIIAADYSQIELRIMAHISGDANLLKAFENNWDIHEATAAEVLGIPLDQVTSDQRRSAKAINFGLIYGMSAFGLAKQLGISREAAQSYIDTYFARYPAVHHYMETTRAKAHKEGYVETLWGRRLNIPDINSSQIPRQKAAERAAINGPLQGSAADIIKMAMIKIDQWLQAGSLDIKMIMQVHDELVFEVAEKDVDAAMKTISELMMNTVELKVPLLVSINYGDNWDAASG